MLTATEARQKAIESRSSVSDDPKQIKAYEETLERILKKIELASSEGDFEYETGDYNEYSVINRVCGYRFFEDMKKLGYRVYVDNHNQRSVISRMIIRW